MMTRETLPSCVRLEDLGGPGLVGAHPETKSAHLWRPATPPRGPAEEGGMMSLPVVGSRFGAAREQWDACGLVCSPV